MINSLLEVKIFKLGILVNSLFLASSINAQLSSLENTTNYFLDSPEATKYVVIMTGPTVGETNLNQFRQWAFSLHLC